MADEIYYDGQGRQQTRRTTTGSEVRTSLATAAAATTAGKNLGSLAKTGGFVPPRQRPDEDSAAYGARVARERAAYNQRQAMK